jgi:poly-beta-hydroxyalkanoate depolymerase
MSGHFATLLRGTIETFLPDHEVYITDWEDARNVPRAAGDFHLDDYIDVVVNMFRCAPNRPSETVSAQGRALTSRRDALPACLGRPR